MSLALFIQIQTLPPNMYQKWKEIFEIVCKKNPMISHRGPTPDSIKKSY
jgi:hypothetical protein